MLYKSLIILAAASATLGATPKGFQPTTEATLLVSYGSNIAANGGNVLQKAATQTAPTVGTQSKLDGTSFAVLMIDLDIPTNNPPATGTLLHWMQTGLTQNTRATAINSTTGTTNAFVLQNSKNQAAFAAYLGPAPPARVPLSHRYTQILVDTSNASANSLSTLQTAASNRTNFNAMTVLTQAGLANKIIAANFFNVTNSTATNGSGGSGRATGTGSSATPTRTFVPGAAVSERASGMLLAIGLVGAVFLSL
ncbi:PEBP-like protein [Annulohypoxylon maeteangense]|uniref:PEBP-like protein n=1 Tax=Annulohypoxylon maeteangense TaxID=1927788 RepID=UPI0020084FA4|nr:PEBP-like protein [Annulohypoxylon maeteangense]KAI0881098.1 PEBP-like protein [Annulohypoxylon maeteangense]